MRHQLLDDPEGLRYGLTARGGSCLEYAGWQARWSGASAISWSGTSAAMTRELAAQAVIEPLRMLFESPARIAVHGSAVLWRGRCWVIMGESGAGKSTTVLSLMREGAALMSDDRVQLDAGRVCPEPLCGMRLWPHVGEPPGALGWAPIAGRGDKRWWRLDEATCAREPARPAGLVLLSPDASAPEEGNAERLYGMSAWQALLGQTFDVTHPWAEWAARRLRETRALVGQAPLWRLRYARGVDRAPRHMAGLYALMEEASDGGE